MLRRQILIVGALSLSTVSASLICAQDVPSRIPRVLVNTALAMFSLSDTTAFSIGRPPRNWPAALVPDGGVHLVGGFAIGPFNELVVRYPASMNATATYQAMLARAGYRKSDSTAPPLEGFGTDDKAGAGARYCSDSAVVVPTPLDTLGYPHQVAFWMIRDQGNVRRCRGEPDPTVSAVADGALHLPPLRAPRGVDVRGGGRSSSNDHVETTASLDTTLSANSILTHYAAELRRGGWRVIGPAHVGNDAGVVSLAARDERGAEWRGGMVVITALDRREVVIRMRTRSMF